MRKYTILLIFILKSLWSIDYMNNDIFNQYHYIIVFEKEFNVKVNFPVIFEDLGNVRAGVCWIKGNNSKSVSLNSRFWPMLNNGQREILIFHELGHCVFRLWHDNKYIGNKPNSIMNEQVMTTNEVKKYYIKYREEYIKKMKKKLDI